MEIREIDQRIWQEELEEFVPKQIFDTHAHIYLSEHDLGSPEVIGIDPALPNIDAEILAGIYAQLLPGREVHNVLFGWVFQNVDFESINSFAARQAEKDALSVSFMLLNPELSPADLAEHVDRLGFAGLKPYLYWTDKRWDAGILDMIPEPLVETADDRNLIVLLHLGKRDSIADRENLESLAYLTRRYENVRWILAHCARSLAPWPLERTIEQIKELPNVWYDVSSVTDPYVYSLMFRHIPLNRILYGSDVPSDLVRGQMVSYGFAWALLTEETIRCMNTAHCNAEPTYMVYETLRALRRGARDADLSRKDIERIFFGNALKLLHGTT